MAKLGKPATRRLTIVGIAVVALIAWLIFNPSNYRPDPIHADEPTPTNSEFLAITILEKLAIKPHYTETKYVRTNFYSNWSTMGGCDMRNIILKRDLIDTKLDGCIVLSGTLHDSYTGKTIDFVRGPGTSSAVQIDHIVALSNAWKTGAYLLDKEQRKAISQDPLNLIAVDGPANQQKSDQDASEWLPPNIAFQCQYVARQISVKFKYVLWVTSTEKSAMSKVLKTCPSEPTVGLEPSATRP